MCLRCSYGSYCKMGMSSKVREAGRKENSEIMSESEGDNERLQSQRFRERESRATCSARRTRRGRTRGRRGERKKHNEVDFVLDAADHCHNTFLDEGGDSLDTGCPYY
jgi:hypothetical protein